jgi:hypothetical protein
VSGYPARPVGRPNYDAALAAYRKADLDLCLRLLGDLDFERQTILRARSLVRLGELDSAHRAIHDAQMQDGGDVERAEVNTVWANVAVKMRRADVDTAFEDAQLYIDATGSRNLRAELDFIMARHAWANGDILSADELALRSVAAGDDDGTSVPHMLHTRTQAIELRALLAQEREDFGASGQLIGEALAAYDSAPFEDAWIHAIATMNLALLVRDFPSVATSADLAARIARVTWGPNLASPRFFCLHGLGWACAHEGDHVGALRAFHHAADASPSAALRVMAWVDHAMLARELCSGPVAEESARYAADAGDSFGWNTVADMERVVLLFLAEALAPLDLRAAQLALKRYDVTRPAEDQARTGIVGSTNVRWRCFEQRASAAVAAAAGEKENATALYRSELASWLRIGSNPRSAVAALDLHALTGDGTFLDVARAAVADTPRSWVAQRLDLRFRNQRP